MSVVLLKFPLVAVFVWVARAGTFLNTVLEMGEFMSQSAVRESLFAELKHAVTHGPGEIKLLRLEAFKNSSCVELDMAMTYRGRRALEPIRAESSSNGSQLELRTAGLTPHFHAGLL